MLLLASFSVDARNKNKYRTTVAADDISEPFSGATRSLLNYSALLYTLRELLAVRIFKTRRFARFARNENISDSALCEAIDRAERGLIDADLGGNLIKQRVARLGEGRRGGYRTIIAYRVENRAVFLHGFPKNAQENIAANELRAMKDAAAELLAISAKAVADMVKKGIWTEVMCDGPKAQDVENA
jgi:hypothetical protein